MELLPHVKVISDYQQLVLDLEFHHWNTTSYVKHTALGVTYDALEALKDSVVERLISEYGRFESFPTREIPSVSIDGLVDAILDLATSLKGLLMDDIDNTADEIIAIGRKLRYLLTLN